jgi:hypothetical protein
LEELGSEPLNRHLVKSALQAMAEGSLDRELDETKFGTLRIHWMQLLIMKGWRYKVKELLRKSVHANDRVQTQLPLALAPFYLLLQLRRMLSRKKGAVNAPD